MIRSTRSIVAVALIGSAAASVALAGPTPEQAELAERLLQTGQRLAAVPVGVPTAKVLADAAERLFENDARLTRTAIDLRLSLGQRDEAIKLLNVYRKLDPADQLAQIQAIDLQQSKMESLPERADYLARVAGSDRVSAEVRSHAATLLAGVESERGRDAESASALAEALALNPLNPAALRLNADALAVHGTAPQRTASLVGLLRANPLEFSTAARLGEELLRSGQTDLAADLYRKFFDAVAAAGFGPGSDDSINAATALQSVGKDREAADIIDAAIKDDGSNTDLYTMRLLLDQAAKDDAGFKATLADTRTKLITNLMGLHTQIDPSAPRLDSATVPALPDVKADSAAVKGGKDPKLADAYLRGLGDLAWLDTFFGRRAPDAAVVEAINLLAGADSVLAHRIAGFSALAADRNDEADVAFSPVAERDSLSRLGLLMLRLKKGQDKAAILADGGKLLAELPTDIWPLTIRQALRDAGPVAFRSADADGVAAEYNKMPPKLFSLAAQPQSVYLVNADPITGSVAIGQPILVRVTLQNISDRPLVIGPGGAIAQQVSLDGTVRGVSEQSFPAAAIAKLTSLLVIQPNQAIGTTVRLDSAELAAFIAGVPQAGASIFVSAVTNPVARQNTVLPGPGGYRQQARGVIDRPVVAFTRPEVRDRLIKQLQDPDSLKRTRAVEAIGACAVWLNGQANNADAKALETQAADLLKQTAEKDASASVRAMAAQEQLSLLSEADRPAQLQKMIAAPDFESKLLGCLLTVNRSKADRTTLLQPLANDSDDIIKRMAAAVMDIPDAPPATKPAQ